MRDSVPSPRYSPVCNVLHQWKTSLIPTYRVYRLCDICLGTHAYVLCSVSMCMFQWKNYVLYVCMYYDMSHVYYCIYARRVHVRIQVCVGTSANMSSVLEVSAQHTTTDRGELT